MQQPALNHASRLETMGNTCATHALLYLVGLGFLAVHLRRYTRGDKHEVDMLGKEAAQISAPPRFQATNTLKQQQLNTYESRMLDNKQESLLRIAGLYLNVAQPNTRVRKLSCLPWVCYSSVA
jgi:hypothetical protein